MTSAMAGGGGNWDDDEQQDDGHYLSPIDDIDEWMFFSSAIQQIQQRDATFYQQFQRSLSKKEGKQLQQHMKYAIQRKQIIEQKEKKKQAEQTKNQK
jgi:hypothetical protein